MLSQTFRTLMSGAEGEIINVLNSYYYDMDTKRTVDSLLSHFDDDNNTDIVNTVAPLNTIAFHSDVLGDAVGKAQVAEMLHSYLTLPFLSRVRHVPNGHSITAFKEMPQCHHGCYAEATVRYYVSIFYKCTPVILYEGTDTLVLKDTNKDKCDEDGKTKEQQLVWKIKTKRGVNLQTNFELLGEMQLQGKKRYAENTAAAAAAAGKKTEEEAKYNKNIVE